MREMQIKSIVRYHFILTRTAKHKRTDNNKCWRECGDIGPLIAVQGRKLCDCFCK